MVEKTSINKGELLIEQSRQQAGAIGIFVAALCGLAFWYSFTVSAPWGHDAFNYSIQASHYDFFRHGRWWFAGSGILFFVMARHALGSGRSRRGGPKKRRK